VEFEESAAASWHESVEEDAMRQGSEDLVFDVADYVEILAPYGDAQRGLHDMCLARGYFQVAARFQTSRV